MALERSDLMTPPTLTPQQRADALAKATATRAARAEMLAAVKNGHLTATQVLTRAETDPMASRTRITALFTALPGVGDVGARKLLTQFGIAPSRRVGGLGVTQRAAIAEADL